MCAVLERVVVAVLAGVELVRVAGGLGSEIAGVLVVVGAVLGRGLFCSGSGEGFALVVVSPAGVEPGEYAFSVAVGGGPAASSPVRVQ